MRCGPQHLTELFQACDERRRRLRLSASGRSACGIGLRFEDLVKDLETRYGARPLAGWELAGLPRCPRFPRAAEAEVRIFSGIRHGIRVGIAVFLRRARCLVGHEQASFR
jgi:hypothetical protein